MRCWRTDYADANADDSTLLAVVRKPADRPVVAASLNWDLDRIQAWCNHWCVILNHKKTKALSKLRLYTKVSTSRTVNPPHGGFVLSVVSICASPNLDILGVKFDRLTFEDHVHAAWYCLPCLSKNWYFEFGEECLCGYLCVASLLLCICSPILEYCSPVWGSAQRGFTYRGA